LHFGAEVFAFWRQSIAREQSIFCLSNVALTAQVINLSDINLINTDNWVDLISGETFADLDGQLTLAPYQTVWISNWLASE
jgi:sucrose phosphorylase